MTYCMIFFGPKQQVSQHVHHVTSFGAGVCDVLTGRRRCSIEFPQPHSCLNKTKVKRKRNISTYVSVIRLIINDKNHVWEIYLEESAHMEGVGFMSHTRASRQGGGYLSFFLSHQHNKGHKFILPYSTNQACSRSLG